MVAVTAGRDSQWGGGNEDPEGTSVPGPQGGPHALGEQRLGAVTTAWGLAWRARRVPRAPEVGLGHGGQQRCFPSPATAVPGISGDPERFSLSERGGLAGNPGLEALGLSTCQYRRVSRPWDPRIPTLAWRSGGEYSRPWRPGAPRPRGSEDKTTEEKEPDCPQAPPIYPRPRPIRPRPRPICHLLPGPAPGSRNVPR